MELWQHLYPVMLYVGALDVDNINACILFPFLLPRRCISLVCTCYNLLANSSNILLSVQRMHTYTFTPNYIYDDYMCFQNFQWCNHLPKNLNKYVDFLKKLHVHALWYFKIFNNFIRQIKNIYILVWFRW